MLKAPFVKWLLLQVVFLKNWFHFLAELISVSDVYMFHMIHVSLHKKEVPLCHTPMPCSLTALSSVQMVNKKTLTLSGKTCILSHLLQSNKLQGDLAGLSQNGTLKNYMFALITRMSQQ